MKPKNRSTLAPLDFIALRRTAGLTQDEFADAIGVHRVSLIRYETGAAPIPKTIEMAARWVARGDAR